MLWLIDLKMRCFERVVISQPCDQTQSLSLASSTVLSPFPVSLSVFSLLHPRYYMRFADNKNSQSAWSKEADEGWLPVDLYVGGQEHAVLHLLYARYDEIVTR